MMPPREFNKPTLKMRVTVHVRRLMIGDSIEIDGVWIKRVSRHKYHLTYFSKREIIETASAEAKAAIRNERAAFRERVNFDFGRKLSDADKTRAVQDTVIDRCCELCGKVPVFQISMFDMSELRAA